MSRRPPRFHDFVGHRKLLAPLRRILDGAVGRKVPMPPVLLTGPSGVGKTQLTRALAKECKSRLAMLIGNVSRKSLLKKLHSLQPGDFLFIDEAHALKPAEQELLFDVIDHGRAPRPDENREKGRGKGTGQAPPEKKNPKRRRLPPFTLVLATDRPGHLLKPLKSRLTIQLHLTPYRLDEMKEIVQLIASQVEVLLSPQAARRVAKASHGLPRRSKHLLVQLRLFTPADRPQLCSGDVDRFLRANGIDRDGLGPQELKYLRFLRKVRKASLETLAQYLGTDRDDVFFQIEPPLVRKGLVVIASGGRRLTEKGDKRAERLRTSNRPSRGGEE